MSRIKVTVEADGKVVGEYAGDSFIAAVTGGVDDGGMDAGVGGKISEASLAVLLAKSLANVVRTSRQFGLDALTVVHAGIDAGLALATGDGVESEVVDIDDRGDVSAVRHAAGRCGL